MSTEKEVKATFKQVMRAALSKEELSQNVWTVYGYFSGDEGMDYDWELEEVTGEATGELVSFAPSEIRWIHKQKNREVLVPWLTRQIAKRSRKL